MPNRIAVPRWLLLAVALLAGCQGVRPGPEVIAPTTGPAPGPAPAKLVELPPPASLGAGVVEPRAGDSLQRALLPLADILATVPRPDYLTAATLRPATLAATGGLPETQPATIPAGAAVASAPAGGADLAEPPLAAQHAYFEGREAFRQGQNFEAIRQLQNALNLAPDRPEILRLLGYIYTVSGNRVRGASYLQQAVKLDAADLDSLFLLGRFEIEQGRLPAAVAVFGHALTLHPREADPALSVLMRYYLAAALVQQGYDLAAVEQYMRYLELPPVFGRTTRFLRELSLLYRERDESWQMVGDALNRLSRPAEALAAYRKADEVDGSDNPSAALVARLLYTHLRLGQVAEAQAVVVEHLRQTKGDSAALWMVAYLAQNGAKPADLAGTLVKVYEEIDRPAALAIALADLLGVPEGPRLLRAHLQAKPADWDVFGRLIKGQLAAGSRAGAVDAWRSAAAAATALPKGAEKYAGLLLDAASENPAAPLLPAFDDLTPAEKAQPVLRYLRAMVLLKAERLDDATADLAQAMDADGSFLAARLMLAKVLLAQGQGAKAEELIKPVASRTDSEVTNLRVQILAQTGRGAEAVRLLDGLIAQNPANLDLVLVKAGLEAKTGDPLGAERTLLDALGNNPTEEKLYAGLFALYGARGSKLPDAERQRLRLLRRAISSIPQARITRLELAQQHLRQREFGEAEKVLRALLAQDPKDYQALELLVLTLYEDNRKDQALALVDERVKAAPQDRKLLGLAREFHLLAGNKDQANQYAERLINLDPPGPERARRLAALYLMTDRAAKAVEVLEQALTPDVKDPAKLLGLLGQALIRTNQAARIDPRFEDAIKRYPKEEAELIYEWAMVLERLGQRDRSEKMLARVLDLSPKHPGASNALGYAWADQGHDLDKARRMIQTALDTDADNAAYLDSIAWAEYKLGQFQAAADHLARALQQPGGEHPVILDHYGDILFRLGKSDEALQVWKEAQKGLKDEEDRDDPEIKALGPRLRDKIDAAGSNRVPKVADVPGAPAAGGPAAPAAPEEKRTPVPPRPPGPPPAPR